MGGVTEDILNINSLVSFIPFILSLLSIHIRLDQRSRKPETSVISARVMDRLSSAVVPIESGRQNPIMSYCLSLGFIYQESFCGLNSPHEV